MAASRAKPGGLPFLLVVVVIHAGAMVERTATELIRVVGLDIAAVLIVAH